MVKRLNLIILTLLFSLLPPATGSIDILYNGTQMYLATGESAILYQDYVLSLKSVSSDGSMWFQLMDNNTLVKNEIVRDDGYFEYSRKNMTIISFKVEKVYSGPSEQNLVSFSLYQFRDPEKPYPDKTIIPENSVTPGDNNMPPETRPAIQPLIWITGIAFILVLLYFVRKLW